MKTYRILVASVAAGLSLGLSACGDTKNPLGSDADDKLASESLTEGDGTGAPAADSGGTEGNLTGTGGGLPVTDQPVTDQPVQTAAIVTVADLIERLGAAGTTAEETGDVVAQPFFTPVGQVLKVAGQDVQVFVYETVEDLKGEARQVGPDGFSIGTTMVSWVAPPRFYATGHVIVLYVGEDAAVMRVLDAALGGPFAGSGADPQPVDDVPIFVPEEVSLADLIDRLQSLELTVEETGDIVVQPFFTPAGQLLRINDEEVQVFVYDTIEQLKKEASQVMPDGSVVGTTTIRWVTPPRFFAIDRFIVLYVGQNEEVIGSLDRVLGRPFAGEGASVIGPLPPIDGGETVFELRNPSIMVATSEGDIEQLAEFTQNPALNERLRQVDLKDNVVVAVFRGEMRTAGYGIEVEELQISDGMVEIMVSLTDPAPDMMVADVITYPVAVYVVSRSEITDLKAIDWVALTADGRVLAKFSYGSVGSGPVDGSYGGGEVTDGISDGYSTDPDGDGAPGVVIDDGDSVTIEPLSVDGDQEPASTVDGADIRGEISSFESVESDNGVVAQILVEGQIDDDTSYDRALVSITSRTVIVQPGVATFAPITFRDLTPGRRVQVLFTGPVAESYPVQATALQVVIPE